MQNIISRGLKYAMEKAHMWRSVDKVVKYAIYATIFSDIYDIGCIGYTYLYFCLIS